jgi:hypothetical protein
LLDSSVTRLEEYCFNEAIANFSRVAIGRRREAS